MVKERKLLEDWPDHIIALKKYGKNKYHRHQYVKNFVKKLDK